MDFYVNYEFELKTCTWRKKNFLFKIGSILIAREFKRAPNNLEVIKGTVATFHAHAKKSLHDMIHH